MGRLIIDGNRIYEVDEQCMKNRQKNQKNQSRGTPDPMSKKPDANRRPGGRS